MLAVPGTGAELAWHWLRPRPLLFIKRGTLYDLCFNHERNVVEGDPLPVAHEVTFQVGKGAFSASTEGTVAYRAGGKLNDT